MAPTKLSELLVRFAPFGFVLLWSTGFIGAKFGLPYTQPFTFLSLRFLVVLILMVPLLILFKEGLPRSPKRWIQPLIVGMLLHGVYLGGVFVAIERGLPAGVTSLIVGTQPLVTSVLALMVLSERLRPVQIGGLLIGFLGLSLVVLGNPFDADPEKQQFFSDLSFFSLWPAFVALSAISGGMILQKRSGAGYGLVSGTFMQYVAALVFNGTMALAFEPVSIDWSWTFVGALAWLIFVLSFGAVGFLMLLIKKGEAAKTSSLFYLTPPLTALIAFFLFDETLSALTLAGMVLTAFGVAMILRRKPRT